MLSKSGRNVNLRISNVYGVELSYGFIGSLFQNIKNGTPVRILKGAEIFRDYISINDVIFAITNLINKDMAVKNINQLFHLKTLIVKTRKLKPLPQNIFHYLEPKL
jgi:nucleoside-diphosphate-sugar epimerase